MGQAAPPGRFWTPGLAMPLVCTVFQQCSSGSMKQFIVLGIFYEIFIEMLYSSELCC